MPLRALLMIALTVLLCACGASTPKKQMIPPPESVEASACLTECNRARGQCRRMFQDQYTYCKRRFEMADRQYEYCKRNKGICVRPKMCTPPDKGICTDQYEGCFTTCGGQIVEVDEQSAPENANTATDGRR